MMVQRVRIYQALSITQGDQFSLILYLFWPQFLSFSFFPVSNPAALLYARINSLQL